MGELEEKYEKAFDVDRNKATIIRLLNDTGRAGIDKLIRAMEQGGFFTAPASGKYHLCCEGGLAEHSLHVLDAMDALCEYFMPRQMRGRLVNSIVLVALLHDLGKMGDHCLKNYRVNLVRSRAKNKETGEYDLVQSEAEPYEVNKDLTYEEHEIRSLLIAERYIFLTEEEETAILHHNGLFGKLDSAYGNQNYCKTELAFLLHTADMFCSRFAEGKNSSIGGYPFGMTMPFYELKGATD